MEQNDYYSGTRPVYVMVMTDDGVTDSYYFVGPFNTESDAEDWGRQQDDVHPTWYVLELDEPAAMPIVLPPSSVRSLDHGEKYKLPAIGERGLYILCWTDSSYHLIGPFGDNDQFTRFINSAEREGDGPCNTPCWHPLLLDEPRRPPQVVPSEMPALC